MTRTIITDSLVDLMRQARREGVEFHAALEDAYDRHRQELQTAPLQTLAVGQRVRLLTDAELFPTGIFRAGLTGTVVEIDHCAMVRLDLYFPDLDEWDNALQVGIDHRFADEFPLNANDLELI